MKIEWAEKIVKVAQEMDLDVTLRDNYVGRGFLRKPTAGIVGALGDLIQSIAAAAVDLAEEQHYDPEKDINVDSFIGNMNLSMDNMGLQFILY